jgi:ABC-2 type transport system permease protein
MSWQRIRHLIRKEFIQMRRDKRTVGVILIAPLFQLVIFGYAVTTDIHHIATAVVDQDHTRQSRELAERFHTAGYFDLRYYPDSPDGLTPLLDSGQAQMALWIPRDFSKKVLRGESAPVQVIVDGSDSTTAGIILGYAQGVFGRYAAEAQAERLPLLLPGTRALSLPAIEAVPRVWYNPDLRSVNFMVPGVLCTLLMVVTMILTSLAIVREREIGTLEQLIVTPLRPGEMMIGKSVPFLCVGLVDVALIVLLARFWFQVPILGSVPLLLGLTVLYVAANLGIGLFISTVSHTQQQASLTSFFIMLPSILLSGFIFPIANMPRVIQYLTYLIPLRYYLSIVRGIFLKGSGITILWPQAVVLAVLATVILTLSAWRFSKRLS